MWIIKNYLKEMGIPVVATMTGDASHAALTRAPAAQLTIVCSARAP